MSDAPRLPAVVLEIGVSTFVGALSSYENATRAEMESAMQEAFAAMCAALFSEQSS